MPWCPLLCNKCEGKAHFLGHVVMRACKPETIPRTPSNPSFENLSVSSAEFIAMMRSGTSLICGQNNERDFILEVLSSQGALCGGGSTSVFLLL